VVFRRFVLSAVLLVPFGVPGVAVAATQVSVVPTNGLQVVVANDDDASKTIDTTLGIDEDTGRYYVAVRSSGALEVGAGCDVPSGGVTACVGDFDAIVVFGNGGSDTVTLDLIADGLPPLHGEAYGGDGDDTLRAPPDGRDVPQPETIIWGEGGNDTIEGGDGNDLLEGGFGHDVLDGGAGVDQFQGDRIEQNVIAIGNDTIRARDGNAEQIACGVGADTAVVDASDVVDPTCESVDRPPFSPPPPPPEKPDPPRISGSSKPKSVAKKGLAITVKCPEACAVVAELRVTKAVARRLKLGRSRVLARGKKSISAAGTARVTLKVVKKARARLRKQKRVKVTLRVLTTIAGITTPESRKVTLKR
jgi:hypothetical protein